MTTPLTPEEEQAMRTLRSWYGLLRLFATLDQVRTERDALQVDLGSVRELLRAAREERDVAEQSAENACDAEADRGAVRRCSRCHREPPNPLGCAQCSPEVLGQRLADALGELEALRRERDAAVEARATAERTIDELRADVGAVISDLHRANQLGPCGEVRQVAIERAIAALRAAVLGGDQ